MHPFYTQQVISCVDNNMHLLLRCVHTAEITCCTKYADIRSSIWIRINHLSFTQVLVNVTSKSWTQFWILAVRFNLKDIVIFNWGRRMFSPSRYCNSKERTNINNYTTQQIRNLARIIVTGKQTCGIPIVRYRKFIIHRTVQGSCHWRSCIVKEWRTRAFHWIAC